MQYKFQSVMKLKSPVNLNAYAQKDFTKFPFKIWNWWPNKKSGAKSREVIRDSEFTYRDFGLIEYFEMLLSI